MVRSVAIRGPAMDGAQSDGEVQECCVVCGLLLSPAAADRLANAGVDRSVRGEEKASDHAPTWVVLRQ